MTEDQLRRWVRNELPPELRRQTTRWVIQCTHPDLGLLLDGMAREHADERADATLSQRGTTWSRLVNRWTELLEGGNAGWLGPGASVVLADADADGQLPWVEVTPTSTGLTVLIRDSDSTEIALVLTDDRPMAARLAPAEPFQHDRWPRTLSVAANLVRPTLWVLRGPALSAAPTAEDELHAALSDPHVEVRSFRWSPEDL